MMSDDAIDDYRMITRVLTISSRQVSIKVERIFWGFLEEIARDNNMSEEEFLTDLSSRNAISNFSQAVREVCIESFRRDTHLRESRSPMRPSSSAHAYIH